MRSCRSSSSEEDEDEEDVDGARSGAGSSNRGADWTVGLRIEAASGTTRGGGGVGGGVGGGGGAGTAEKLLGGRLRPSGRTEFGRDGGGDCGFVTTFFKSPFKLTVGNGGGVGGVGGGACTPARGTTLLCCICFARGSAK